ncbi:MAG: hypothetical protein V8S34_00585 [Lawsonibacter sp.]
MEYSDLILCIRKQCALSQEELAKELGVSFAWSTAGSANEPGHRKWQFAPLKNFAKHIKSTIQ